VDVALWSVAALVGVGGLNYALRRASRDTVRDAVLCLVTGGSVGTAIFVVADLTRHTFQRPAPVRLLIGAESLALYFAVVFVLEEVSFRGAIDSHVHHPGQSRGLLSAVFVSALWGLWHLPISSGPVATAALRLLVVHVPIGVVLSIFWRRSGNLAVPAFTHAFIDAVRNALLA
jgi:membrane protease YdiL (CAAX protease family)